MFREPRLSLPAFLWEASLTGHTHQPGSRPSRPTWSRCSLTPGGGLPETRGLALKLEWCFSSLPPEDRKNCKSDSWKEGVYNWGDWSRGRKTVAVGSAGCAGGLGEQLAGA